MTRRERRAAERALGRVALREARLRVAFRCLWAVGAAQRIAGWRVLPVGIRARLCHALLRLPRVRVGLGAWERLPFEVVP
ncbi:MAG: hypothetical protein AMXMBFR53_30010 [Gemmatimonadota bacterium]